jgi:CRISPR-associated protein Cas2
MNSYLICYDIACEKRLAKVARALEKECLRVQYSVFLLPLATRERAQAIAQSLADLIDPQADDLRLYPITNPGLRSGTAPDLNEPLVVC